MSGRIPPTTWGPFFWHTMHLVALGYPSSPTYAEKRAAKEFYESLAHLIPCPTCKLHYAENIKKDPISPSVDSKDDGKKYPISFDIEYVHQLQNIWYSLLHEEITK